MRRPYFQFPQEYDGRHTVSSLLSFQNDIHVDTELLLDIINIDNDIDWEHQPQSVSTAIIIHYHITRTSQCSLVAHFLHIRSCYLYCRHVKLASPPPDILLLLLLLPTGHAVVVCWRGRGSAQCRGRSGRGSSCCCLCIYC